MSRLIVRLRILKIYIQLVFNPMRTEIFLRAIKILVRDPDQRLVHQVEANILANRDFNEMYERNYAPELPSFAMLDAQPEDSFGRALAKHLKDNALGFELFLKFDQTRPVEYITQRIYQDHDLWHVLLGYGIGVEDELALQAFSVAQLNSPFGMLIISGGFLHLLGWASERATIALKKVTEGYARGRKAKFLLGIPLHEFFAKPLTEVRAMCNVRAEL